MIETDNSVRLKVTNRCQLSCHYCHNEGTELSYLSLGHSLFIPDENLSTFHALRDIPFDPDLLQQLDKLASIGVRELHFTGGEPSLNPNLLQITEYLTKGGFRIRMTSNGLFSSSLLATLVDSGLNGINFSVFSLTPEKFVANQANKSLIWAQRMIDQEILSILKAKEIGLEVKLNTVVTDKSDYTRLDPIVSFCNDHNLTLAFLNDLTAGKSAILAIADYLEEQGAYLVDTTEFTNNSKGKNIYHLPNGQIIVSKYFRNYHPGFVCEGCEFKDSIDCLEKYYGIRLEYRDVFYVRLCIQKATGHTLMALDDFLTKGVYNHL